MFQRDRKSSNPREQRFEPVITALQSMDGVPSKRPGMSLSTLVVSPFVCLRLPTVGEPEVWLSQKASEPSHGNVHPPFNAIRFKCDREGSGGD